MTDSYACDTGTTSRIARLLNGLLSIFAGCTGSKFIVQTAISQPGESQGKGSDSQSCMVMNLTLITSNRRKFGPCSENAAVISADGHAIMLPRFCMLLREATIGSEDVQLLKHARMQHSECICRHNHINSVHSMTAILHPEAGSHTGS